MYYDLKKDEYMEYEKKFKSTYVGKQLFQARMMPAILGCILWGIGGGIVGYNSIDSIQFPLSSVAFFLIGGLTLLESVLWHIEYRKELKNYITKKTK